MKPIIFNGKSLAEAQSELDRLHGAEDIQAVEVAQADGATAPNVGQGPYSILETTEGYAVVETTDGKERVAAGPFKAAKTAARKARELNAAHVEPTPAPKAKKRVNAPKPEAKPEPMPEPELVTEGEVRRLGTSLERHEWLEAARDYATGLLEASGTEPAAGVRISIGMPFRAGKHTIGQCWHKSASEDGHAEVFVSPVLTDSETILGVVTHELIHAALPDGEGHGPNFKKAALAVGLEGKMTATTVGDALKVEFAGFIAEHGQYPGAAIDPKSAGGKKQTTRMIKAQCPICDYSVRTTRVWLAVATPKCPNPDCAHEGEDMDVAGAE